MNSKNIRKGITALLAAVMVVSVLAVAPLASANGSDYFVYSTLDTGVSGSYGVDGYVGADCIDRIIFYSPGWEGDLTTATAYIYIVTIPEGTDPNTHPNNSEAPGPIATRTFTLEKTFDLGVNPGHESEFYVDAENDTMYLGASVGIRRYVYDDATVDNYIYDSSVAPPAPMEGGYGTQSLAYDPANDMWYAGSIAWNNNPGITLRDVWKYDGSQGNAGIWQLAFQYTTPEGTDPMTHHDGMEFISGHLFLADYAGDYIKQYTTDGTLVNVFWRDPLGHELEGMGFGALTHFWCGSHENNITEFGGGRLQQEIGIGVYVDIKPGSCPNPLNLKSNGVLPVAVLGTAEFDVTTIDPETIELTREGIEDGVAPIRWSYEDVATPFEGEPCECHDLNGDGYIDLTLKFDNQELVETLGLSDEVGNTIPITLTGNLKGENSGTPIEGEDCIWVLKQGKK